MSGHRPRKPMLAAAGVAWLVAAPALAAPLPEPALKFTAALTAPAQSAAKDDRALLRLEWRAGQSRADEVGIVDDMLARVQRMEATVADIRVLLQAVPAPSPAVAELPEAAAAPSVPPEAGGLPWTALAAGALGFFTLGWLWRQRSVKARSPTPALIAAEPPLPEAPPPAEKPAPAGEPLRHREPSLPDEFFARRQPRPAPPPRPIEEPPPVPPEPPPAPSEPAPFLEPIAFTPPEARPETAAAAQPASGDQGLELAEIMMSMGLSHGAAQTLLDQISKNPQQALYYWLKLLDVYRRSQRQEEFEEAAQELRQHFNVQALAWEETAVHASIEDYPHIAGRIAQLWGKPAVVEYLERLLQDNRGGTRAGFPQPVAEEILLLIEIRKLTQL